MRLANQAKKSCIVHNTDPKNCGCSDEVSQADFFKKEVIVNEIPFIVRMGGLPEGMTLDTKGPFLAIWETRRSTFAGYPSQESKLVSFTKVETN